MGEQAITKLDAGIESDMPVREGGQWEGGGLGEIAYDGWG